jgi:hypothetical protein
VLHSRPLFSTPLLTDTEYVRVESVAMARAPIARSVVEGRR